MFYRVVLALLLVSLAVRAEPIRLPLECQKPSVKTVSVPISPSIKRTFPLRFEERAFDPALPTVVVVPPIGIRNIFADRNDFESFHFLPESVNVISLEYRGMGCNADSSEQVSLDTYSLAQAADDFLGVIRSRNLQKYFLFGVDSGSAVARIMASKAKLAGVEEPQALVMTSPLGRAWKRREHFKEGAIEEWDRLKREMNPEGLAIVNDKNVFAKHSKRAWGKFFFRALVPGWVYPGDGTRRHGIFDFIHAFSSGDKQSIEQIDAAVKRGEGDGRGMAQNNFFSSQVYCHEISQTDDERLEFTNGKLRLAGGGYLCQGTSLDNPYDVAKWPIGVNQYIIQGKRDPLNPEWQVRYLLDKSPFVDTSVLWGLESGHGLATQSLAACRSQIWSAILSYRRFNATELTDCKAPIDVDYQQQY